MPEKSFEIRQFVDSVKSDMRRVHQAASDAARRGEAHMVTVSSEDQEGGYSPDEGIFARAWQVEEAGPGVSILVNDAPHAAIVELGSRPHWPPLLPILEYMGRRLNVSTNGVTQSGRWDLSDQKIFREVPELENLRRIAVRVATKIANQGTPARNLLANNQDHLSRIFQQEIDRVLRSG